MQDNCDKCLIEMMNALVNPTSIDSKIMLFPYFIACILNSRNEYCTNSSSLYWCGLRPQLQIVPCESCKCYFVIIMK